MKQVQDVVERLWDFIDKLDINTFGKFLADNIVGSVVAFSLLFWVPFSILVHCVVGPRTHQYTQFIVVPVDPDHITSGIFLHDVAAWCQEKSP